MQTHVCIPGKFPYIYIYSLLKKTIFSVMKLIFPLKPPMTNGYLHTVMGHG